MILAAALGLVALIAVGSIWGGFVLSVLWGWFMVPTFHLPALSIPAAIGVALVMGMLTHQHPKQDDEPFFDLFVRAFSVSLIVPLAILGVGWIVARWMP